MKKNKIVGAMKWKDIFFQRKMSVPLIFKSIDDASKVTVLQLIPTRKTIVLKESKRECNGHPATSFTINPEFIMLL